MGVAENLTIRVRKAISQKYDGKNICEVGNFEFSSPMEVLSFITGIKYNGSLIDNSINI